MKEITEKLLTITFSICFYLYIALLIYAMFFNEQYPFYVDFGIAFLQFIAGFYIAIPIIQLSDNPKYYSLIYSLLYLLPFMFIDFDKLGIMYIYGSLLMLISFIFFLVCLSFMNKHKKED